MNPTPRTADPAATRPRAFAPAVAALLFAALALAAVAWALVLASAPVTGPQPMRWQRADGSPPAPADAGGYPFRGCRLADVQLDMALWNGGAIVPCHDPALGSGWAFLDPRRRTATLRWPLADDGEAPLTLGLSPGPGRRLALVFQRAVEGDAFVGIAGADGWARAPEKLGRVRYLAAAWVGDRLELALVPLTGQDPHGLRGPVKVVGFDDAGRQERIAVRACGADCPTPPIAYRAGARWVFEYAGRARAEGGEPVAPAFPGRTLEDLDLDLVAQGRLRSPIGLSLGRGDTPAIGADGKPTLAAPAPWDGMRTVRQERFVVDVAPQRRAQWAEPSLRAITERAGARTLTWYTDERDRVHVTDARQPTIEAMAALPAVARWPQGLASRMFASDDAGGWWLVDSSGESIHLDRDLRRTDPLPLRQHLRDARGEIAVYALDWALFALPALSILCAGLSLCAAPRRPLLRARPLAIAALLYLPGAVWALLQVAPLL
ncbi:hypothetical protein GLE_4097 [Lysobacter enzymogenes]|uniref:Uncharacterized protein n=1 Tax=Lysobacter enzymogenes TaxID=69 RepID=A0A0S2DMB5_LYSEN|nr:hypothetical protein [Lysobacter enzymogenes]ALN59439.1 hypothetical protein GLE_4097 [Lysobacter enzymogenes]